MKGCTLGFGLLLLLGLGTAVSNAQVLNVSEVLDGLLQGYDKRIRPDRGGVPVDVGVTMYFLKIFDISTKDKSLKTDFYFRQVWNDPRLAFEARPGLNHIVLGSESSKMFWQPDTFFPEGFTKHSPDGQVFFRIASDGTVKKSIRLILISGLEVDLRYFPFDYPRAALSMESYGYTASDIRYKWEMGSSSVGIAEEARDSGSGEISVLGSQLGSSMIHLSSGNYSRLEVNLSMSRGSGHYLSHFYLPAIISFLFVWASFWFHPTVPVVRVLLVLSSFLTGNFLLSSSWNYVPAVGFSTMLEKFLVFGLVLSALALAECALVVYLQRRARKAHHETGLLEGADKPTEKKLLEDKAGQEAASYLVRSTRYLLTIHQHSRSHHKIDVFFRVTYPAIYVVYNIWYWTSFP